MMMRITALSLALAAGTTFAQTVVLTSNTTLNPGATTIGGVPLATADVVVQGVTLTVNGAHTIRSLEVRRSETTGPGVVTHGPQFTYTDGLGAQAFGAALTVTGNCFVEGVSGGSVASAIDVSAKGYLAGQGPGSRNINSGGQCGATHGGRGGFGGTHESPVCHGTVGAPTLFGSGAPIDCGGGQVGGGVFILSVGGTLTVDGAIRANAGTTGTVCGSGGAAGGSIWITASTLAGAGTISTNGASSNRSDVGGGGGGRIAVYYTSSSFTGAMQSFGGADSLNQAIRRGGAGTVWVKPAATPGTLSVDNNGNTGGTTDVSGATILNGDLVVQGGAELSHFMGETGTHLTVTGDVFFGAGSGIDVDGRGFGAGQGPGAYGVNSGGQGGSGHGGRGGDGSIVLGGVCYGSLEYPTDLGSGGGLDCNVGGRGGGAFHLTVGGTFTNDGYASSSGITKGANCGASGATGGSILIETSTLAGGGAFAANGAPSSRSDAGGGGGGRIAVYYEGSEFTGTMIAQGGNPASVFNAARRGGAGTIWLQPGSGLATMIIDNNGVLGQRTELSGEQELGAHLIIDNGGSLSCPPLAEGTHLTFLGDITVADDAEINVDGRGHPAGQGPSSLNFSGGGKPGAGHGGRGGDGSGLPGLGCYGSVDQPVDLGSGAPIDCNSGARGGGAIRVTSAGTFTIDGRATANANTFGMTCGSGGASGGSVWLEAETFSGSGVVSADGGPSARSDSAGGGGGRVSMTCTTNDFAGSVHAYGGTANIAAPDPARRAGAGTVWIKEAGAPGSLIVDNGGNRHQTTDFVDVLRFDANMLVTNGGVVSHGQGDAENALELTGDVTITSGGAISLTGRGYTRGEGPGSYPTNSGGHGGAGHGGRGGNGAAVPGGATYGSVTSPIELGSGSGLDCNGGGTGGGALRLYVGGTLTVDGEISANGSTVGAACGSSGAAGGSIWIHAINVTGSGIITANGTVSARTDAGAGGGGRIAIYSCNNSVPLANIVALGGGGTRPGQPGTVFFGAGSIDITAQPVDVLFTSGQVVELTTEAVSSQSPSTITYQWRKRQRFGEYAPIVEGEDGRYFGVTTPTLTIADINCDDGGYYDCLLTDACGVFPTVGAFVSVRSLADYDLSGGVDGDDVIAFFSDWDRGLIEADVNQDGGVDGDDVILFFAIWDRAC
jgi:hypothetical protein